MEILKPHLRVHLTLEEFMQGRGREFPEKYIRNPNGELFKRTELSHGRFIQYKVDSLPTDGAAALPSLKTEFAFLPSGKVPISLLHQITDFFKRVMQDMGGDKLTSHGALEAMAHIVWNPSRPQEYQVRIPSQEVSAARVSYEFDHLLDGDVIVVDIHSHNTMGAFFSGTDDADDKKNTCYSGVIGKLNTAEPMTKWRFNDLNHKIDCELSEIFASESVKCPDEWLTKVTQYKWQGGYGFANRGANNISPLVKSGRGVMATYDRGNKTRGGGSIHDRGMQSAYGMEDDLYNGFGMGDEYMDSLFNQAAGELEQMEKDGIDMGFSKVGANTISDVELLESMLISGELTEENFAEVMPRFYQTKHQGTKVWVDTYQDETSDDDTGTFTYLSQKEKEDKQKEEGAFIMYIPYIDTYIASADITKESTGGELWDIFITAEGNVEEDSADSQKGYVDVGLESTKGGLMNFLRTGTSSIDRIFITAYLFNLHEQGKLKPSIKKEEKRNVQLH